MKLTGRKFFKIGKKLKLMGVGGLGKSGPYLYTGVKTKKGLSAGASVGTKGKQVYVSTNKSQNQARIKHNLTSGATQLRLKKKKPHY